MEQLTGYPEQYKEGENGTQKDEELHQRPGHL